MKQLGTAMAVLTLMALCVPPGAIAANLPENGKIGYLQAGDVWTINVDGSGATNVTSTADTESCPKWAPSGQLITFVRGAPNNGVYVMKPDGTGQTELDTKPDNLGLSYEVYGCPQDWSPDSTEVVYTFDDHCDAGGIYVTSISISDPQQVICGGPCTWDSAPDDPDWSPDGTRMAVVGCKIAHADDLWTMRRDGADLRQLTFTPASVAEYCPDYSPDGAAIAYIEQDWDTTTYQDLYRINSDGTGRLQLTDGPFAGCPQWSPDGTTIAFTMGSDVWTVKPDGSALTNVTNNAPTDSLAAWSPDGKKILFASNRDGQPDLYTMNPDGSGINRVTNTSASETNVGWQAIVKGYVRPRGATPFRAALVTAYEQCAASDRTHGPPLAFPSCANPQMASDFLTVGTGDSNGRPALNEGSLTLSAIVGDPVTDLIDEADVRVEFFMDDVFTKPGLADYTGELRVRVPIQITDKSNAGKGQGTTVVTPLEFFFPCAATAATNEGSTCTASTSVDAWYAGALTEGRRAMWQLGRAEVYDGGADGDAQTPAADTLFATQGLFIP